MGDVLLLPDMRLGTHVVRHVWGVRVRQRESIGLHIEHQVSVSSVQGNDFLCHHFASRVRHALINPDALLLKHLLLLLTLLQ